jgi:tRNA-(ms[2]io[6]A)-hydroxylase
MTDIAPLLEFLPCRTPQAWIGWALENETLLLIDHAHCEKKAASTALNLMFRYVDRPELLDNLSQLAREELLHFEQVVGLMRERGIRYDHLSPSRYAGALRAEVRTSEPQRLVDTLIVGALIEARSCERFAALAPHVDAELGRYYRYLLKSESRHFEDYVAHAVTLAIGAGELRPDTPVRQVVMLITPLWYFGSLLTQHSGLNKLLDHYKAVSDTIAAAYGTH